MKVYIPETDLNAIGGGHSFLRTFLKYAKNDIALAHNVEDCDVMFIPGPTLAKKEEVELAKKLEKGIVLRVDNIPEDYRNRGTALSRLKKFSQMADVVVYQSIWARDYVMAYTGVDGTVVYNGVDKDIFFNEQDETNRANKVLYVRSSSNENKRWQEAKYYFRKMWLENKQLIFNIIGNFNDYVKLYGDEFLTTYKLGMFDEPSFYHGNIKDPKLMAHHYNSNKYVLVPFYNDACSNVVLEARACGCEIITCLSGKTGGTPELLLLPDDQIGADRMAKEYLSLFKLALQ